MGKEQIVVVGAGVAGLTAAYLLLKKGYGVTVLEREKAVGGLARSYRYDKYTFDIGPHRFHTDRKDVMDFIKFVLNKDALVISRMSSVYMFDKYHIWPLRPRTLIRLPFTVLLRAGIDLFTRPSFKGESFKNYILSKYGKTLYEVFFKQYTEKFTFISGANLHYSWASASVDRAVIDKKLKMNSLFDTLKVTLMPKPVNTKFLYPKHGCDIFAIKLANLIKEEGGHIITNVKNVLVKKNGKKIDSISFNGKNMKIDKLIWTASIKTISEQLGLDSPKLNYLDTLIFNVEINRDLGNPNQWVYFGDKNIIFNRTSIPKNFSPYLVPKGKDSICVEVTCRDKELWDMPAMIMPRVLKDLIKTKMCKRNDIGKVHVEKVRETYPIYSITYPGQLKKANENLKTFANLYCTGRTGAFYYNNMDNSIEMIFDLIKQFPEVKG